MNKQLQKQLIAEFVGTYMLVLIGAGAVIQSPASVGMLIPAFSHGLIVIAIITTFGHISGAHVNPAVSIGMLVGGKLNLYQFGWYVGVQVLGGVAAAATLWGMLPDDANLLAGQTVPANGVNELGIVVFEGLLTFFLVSAIYQSGGYTRWGNLTPLLVGLTLAGLILFGGPLTGASLNPARTIGPALINDATQPIGEVIIYIVATLLGGTIAGILHSDMFAPEESTETTSKKAHKKKNNR